MFDFASEPTIRLTIFAAVLAVMGLWELAAPKRTLVANKPLRWFTNLAIVVIDSAMLRLLFPVLAVGVAMWAHTNGWGLLALTDWPAWLELMLAVVVLDLAIYIQHVAGHKIPILWTVHRMHHADRDIDVSTALRFHPIEIALSMLWKMAVILALGPSALAVFVFEVILNALAMFNHANVAMPRALDAALRLVIVTPDMHRVHHSVRRAETDSNYGFNLSIWDRAFRTYRPQPEGGHQAMSIGLPAYRDERPGNLLWCLKLPFAGRGKT